MSYTRNTSLTFAFILFVHSFIVPFNGQGQSNCPNSDFSLGDFSNWEGYYGDFNNPALHVGFAVNRHMIIKAPAAFDPNTCDKLNPIPPGAAYSARLGDDTGSHAEQLKYTVGVTDETNMFIYKYAVVLQDLPHTPEDSPSFTIEVSDSSGNVIDSICGYYYVFANQGMPGWHLCKNVVWKDWTPMGIDLTKYIGQTVSIIFTTRDCALGVHYGYAYLSAYCSPKHLTFTFCPGDPVAIVTAPSGFLYLWPNGDTTQSTIIQNPYVGMVDSCVLTSANGCKVTVKDTLKIVIAQAGFGAPRQSCRGSIVQFHDSSTINPDAPANRIWDFGDGSPLITNILNPWHAYDSAGTYEVTLIILCDGGCPDTIKKTIDILSFPEIQFTVNPPCNENSRNDTLFFYKEVQLNVAQGYDHYRWNTGDTTFSIKVTDQGWYSVSIENAGNCHVTDSVLLLPCFVALSMPNAFSPNGDGLNDLFLPMVHTENILAFHMQIFDRWGKDIFGTQDIGQGWDGTIAGEQAPPGVYVYTITYLNDFGENKNLTGTVTLIR